jgi:hypothetical protein
VTATSGLTTRPLYEVSPRAVSNSGRLCSYPHCDNASGAAPGRIVRPNVSSVINR